MATYYIGADVHVNNTELAVEYRRKIVQRYSVSTTIPAISTVLASHQGKKFLAMEQGPTRIYRYTLSEAEIEVLCARWGFDLSQN